MLFDGDVKKEISHIEEFNWSMDGSLSVRVSCLTQSGSRSSVIVKFGFIMNVEYIENETKFVEQNVRGKFSEVSNKMPGFFVSQDSEYLKKFISLHLSDDFDETDELHHYIFQSYSGGVIHVIAIVDGCCERMVEINAH